MLSRRELATVLAALRYWQDRMHHNRSMPLSLLSHFEEARPLASVEIDALCERLNLFPTGEEPR